MQISAARQPSLSRIAVACPAVRVPASEDDADRDDIRDRLAAFVEAGVAANPHLSIPAAAKRAGISPATIYRWQKKAGKGDVKYANVNTMAKIWGLPNPFAENRGEAPPSPTALAPSPPSVRGELREDVAPYDGPPLWPDEPFDANFFTTTLKVRLLELAGYLQGDILRVDRRVAPRRGDIVVIRKEDPHSGEVETLVRIWMPPLLMTWPWPLESVPTPIFIDETVTVMGTVVSSVRRRPS